MKLLRLVSTATLLISILFTGQNASAISAGELKNFKVIGHHFTTSFTNGKRYSRVKKPSEARMIVIKLAVKAPSDDSKIFINDFVLQYFHQDGKEDRAKCSAICRAKTEKLGENKGCGMGNGAWIRLDKKSKYLSLMFFLENDVKSVDISRTDAPPLTYRVGSDRTYSVFISTNQKENVLSEIEKVIRAGGYQITRTSTSLPKEEKGIIIHYAEGAETQAREISQRIMIKTNVAPEVKKMELISSNDIVVWIGKNL